MILKALTLLDLIIEEHALSLRAQQKYGELYRHTVNVYDLIGNFFIGYNGPFDQGVDLFLRFHTEMRNSYLLSMFSTVRLHAVQSSINLREFMEASCNTAYSIANPRYEDFVDTDETGTLDPSDDLKKKRYRWLNNNYPARSNDLEKIKKNIQFNSHSNLVNTYRNAKHIFKKDKSLVTNTLFFDFEDQYLLETSLWQLSNTGLACLNLIYEINRDLKKFVLINNYEEIHSKILDTNLKFKDLFTKTDRFKKADKIATKKEKNINIH